MPRKYIKMEVIAEEVFKRKAKGETNREIGEHFGLTKDQIKQLVTRQNRKKRKIIQEGYIPRAKGRPRISGMNDEESKEREIKELQMQVELLRNFLSEVGRR